MLKYWSVCTGVRGSTRLDFQNSHMLISMYRCERFHKPGLSKWSHVDQYVQEWEVPQAWTFKTVTCWSVCTGVRGSTSLDFQNSHMLISMHRCERFHKPVLYIRSHIDQFAWSGTADFKKIHSSICSHGVDVPWLHLYGHRKGKIWGKVVLTRGLVS